MRLFNSVFNYLIQTGFLGAFFYAVFQYVASKKRESSTHTYNDMKSRALDYGSTLLRQPDADEQKVINAIVDDLRMISGKWFWHSFSDSTLGNIARNTVQGLLSDPNFISTFDNSKNTIQNGANNVATQSSSQSSNETKQAPAPANLDEMIANEQAKQ